MKRITTEVYETPVVLTNEEIKTLIEELPFDEHRFVVFAEDGNEGNYVQAILENEELGEESRYMVEARIYKTPNDFTHYRTFMETAQEVISVFEAFAKDMPYNYADWEDVTKEF